MSVQFSWEKWTTTCTVLVPISSVKLSLIYLPVSSFQLFSVALSTLPLDCPPTSHTPSSSSWVYSFCFTALLDPTHLSSVQSSQTSNWLLHWPQSWLFHSCCSLVSSSTKTTFPFGWSNSSTCHSSSTVIKHSWSMNIKVGHSSARTSLKLTQDIVIHSRTSIHLKPLVSQLSHWLPCTLVATPSHSASWRCYHASTSDKYKYFNPYIIT